MLLRKALILTIFLGTLAPLGSAQQPTKVSLDVSETLFSLTTAINACGYDQDLASADPLRLRIRAELSRETENSYSARKSLEDVCVFYHDHQQLSSSRDLAQYISLALNLGTPPAFTPNVKEADLPPDAAYVLGVQHVLQTFYTAANLHGIWLRHSNDYEAFVEHNNEAVAKMIMATDVYLKIPVGGYAGRRLSIFIEPMAAGSQANARSYGTDYFIVLAPENGGLKMDQIRHTYLHFVLDPMAMKRGITMQRLEPLLDSVQTAPIDNSFKTDITLLVTESLIKAIEARTEPGQGKEADLKRQQKANDAAREGYILAPYFYDRLVKFEKDPIALQDVYGDWLHYIDVQQEKHRASQIQFAPSSAPEIVRAAKPANPLNEAEKYFAAGDFTRAKELAQKALDSSDSDKGRTQFLLARIAISTKDLPGAQALFEKAIEVSREPRVIAWSNIYLGRIYDLKSDRETAVKHYRAALESGDSSSITRSAAERGLKQPYQPPATQNPQGTQQ